MRCRRLSASTIDCTGFAIGERFACRFAVPGDDDSPMNCAWFRNGCIPEDFDLRSTCGIDDVCCHATSDGGVSPFTGTPNPSWRSSLAFTRAFENGRFGGGGSEFTVTYDAAVEPTFPSIICSPDACAPTPTFETFVIANDSAPGVVLSSTVAGRTLWFFFELYGTTARLCVGAVDVDEPGACDAEPTSLPRGCATSGTAALADHYSNGTVAARIEAEFPWGHVSIAY